LRYSIEFKAAYAGISCDTLETGLAMPLEFPDSNPVSA